MDDLSQQQMKRCQDYHWWFVARRINIKTALDRHLSTYNNTPIVEIGCGSGGNFDLLCRYRPVIGVELSRFAYLQSLNHSPSSLITVVNQDAHSFLEGRAGQFEVVCAFDVLEHMSDDEEVIGLVYNALKPSGLFFISVPLCPWLYSAHDRYLSHFRRYTRVELFRKLNNVGFQVVYSRAWLVLLFPALVISRLAAGVRDKYGLDYEPPGVPPWFINSLLVFVHAVETRLCGLLNIQSGGSLVVVCRKA